MTPRRRPTLRQQAEIMLRQKGRCVGCRGKFVGFLGAPEWDHIQPLALGGDNSTENFQALCIPCHDKKTNGVAATTHGSDKFNIAKAGRIARGGKKKSPGPKSRGFDKTRRKRMSGKVERR